MGSMDEFFVSGVGFDKLGQLVGPFCDVVLCCHLVTLTSLTWSLSSLDFRLQTLDISRSRFSSFLLVLVSMYHGVSNA